MKTLDELGVLIARCQYPGFEFKLSVQGGEPWVQIVCPEGVDTVTGAPVAWKGRKWKLSYHMTDTEVVQTLWAAVQRALLHEASELFKFDQVALFDRHISVHRMVEMIRTHGDDALDGRPPI